jgi:hypothetical protein
MTPSASYVVLAGSASRRPGKVLLRRSWIRVEGSRIPTFAVTPTSASIAATASVSCLSFRWMPVAALESTSTPLGESRFGQQRLGASAGVVGVGLIAGL